MIYTRTELLQLRHLGYYNKTLRQLPCEEVKTTIKTTTRPQQKKKAKV